MEGRGTEKMNGKLRNMTCVYISAGDTMLLLYRMGSKVVSDSWCGIGGHFEKDELNDARACVLRELYEEMQISEDQIENLRLRYVTLRLKNGEIRQNYYFFADLKPGVDVKLSCNEGHPEWVVYQKLLDRNMPYTAWYVLEHYLREGKKTEGIYSGIAKENGVEFVELKEF